MQEKQAHTPHSPSTEGQRRARNVMKNLRTAFEILGIAEPLSRVDVRSAFRRKAPRGSPRQGRRISSGIQEDKIRRGQSGDGAHKPPRAVSRT